MKIVITSKKPVLTDKYGRLPKDKVIDIDDSTAKFLIERKDAILYETKEGQDNTLKVEIGQVSQQSVLPVAPVLPKKTLTKSKCGAKKAIIE